MFTDPVDNREQEKVASREDLTSATFLVAVSHYLEKTIARSLIKNLD
jgi:hypothetical protein